MLIVQNHLNITISLRFRFTIQRYTCNHYAPTVHTLAELVDLLYLFTQEINIRFPLICRSLLKGSFYPFQQCFPVILDMT